MDRKIPYSYLGLASTETKKKWTDQVNSVINDGVFVQGEYVKKFENEWSQYLGCKFSIGTGNGLDGLIIALKAIGIQPGDDVAVPAHTFIACHLAISQVGAIPISVDVEKNGLISIEKLIELPKPPKAVIAVHLHGSVLDMTSLVAWAKKNDVLIIEDVSQAHGATREGQKAGTFGDISVFSLYPTKNLGALGDAGIISTNSEVFADFCRTYSNYGSDKNNKYRHQMKGINSRLDPIQAAILSINLPELDDWNRKRRDIASRYISAFTEVGIQILQELDNGNVFHHFALLVNNRNQFQNLLNAKYISSEIHYPICAADEWSEMNLTPISNFHIARQISQKTISIPLHPWMSSSDIEYVIDNVIESFEKSN